MEDKTIPVREGEEFDRDKVACFLREHIDGLADVPMEVRQYPTGASNLTYFIRIGEWEAVLRRPPWVRCRLRRMTWSGKQCSWRSFIPFFPWHRSPM